MKIAFRKTEITRVYGITLWFKILQILSRKFSHAFRGYFDVEFQFWTCENKKAKAD